MHQQSSHSVPFESTNSPAPEIVRAHDVAMLRAAVAYLVERSDAQVDEVLVALIQHVQGDHESMSREERAIVKDLARRVFEEPDR